MVEKVMYGLVARSLSISLVAISLALNVVCNFDDVMHIRFGHRVLGLFEHDIWTISLLYHGKKDQQDAQLI